MSVDPRSGRARRAKPSLLTIIMPVYNERATLRTSLERLLKTDLPLDLEVLVVDDGSTDGCTTTITDLVENGSVRLITKKRNEGKGRALRTGIDNARGDLIAILDADLEYDPADYRLMLPPILEGDADVVYGTRSFAAHTAFSFWYVIANKFLALWASFLFSTWVTDTYTCLKLASAELWRSLDLNERGFGVEAEATAKFLKAGHLVYEIPISYRARRREEGKKLDWTDGVHALWVFLKIRVFPPRRNAPSPR